MRLLELCAGIGAMSYVWSHVLGQEIAGQVEIDPYCQAVLAKHFPGVKRVADIREVMGDEFGPVDLVAGGFPCQPASYAGRRRGTSDDRWLWPDVYRVIRAAQPTWALLENVPGLISLGLEDVLTDLDAAGYEAWPLVLPAAAIGAPHLRERVFVVAHRDSELLYRDWNRGQERRSEDSDRRGVGQADPTARGIRCGTASWPGGQSALSGESGARFGVGQSDADSLRRQQIPRSAHGDEDAHAWRRAPHDHELAGDGQGAALLADASESGRGARQRDLLSRLGQSDLERRSRRQAQPRMGGVLDGLSGWLDCVRWPAGPSEAQHDWEPPRTVTGTVANRAARLKALGNAIVPQQVAPILAAIVAAEAEMDCEVTP